MSIAQSWRPRHALFFTGAALFLTFLAVVALIALAVTFPSLAHFLSEPAEKSGVMLCGFLIIFGVGLFFARVRTRADFISGFGLTRPSEREIFLAVIIGLLLQFIGIYSSAGGLSHLRASRSLHPVDIAVILAPFFEEPVMRGFVYRAFRNSYPIAGSICFTVLIALVFHLRADFRFIYFATLAALNVALCLLKERYSSLWNCIACHFAFNVLYVSIEH
jgi:membrane protease YdiL (CAAX protease family)